MIRPLQEATQFAKMLESLCTVSGLLKSRRTPESAGREVQPRLTTLSACDRTCPAILLAISP